MLLYSQVNYLSSMILLVTCLRLSNSQQQHTSQPEVTIPQGTLRGTTRTTHRNRTIPAFLAIPYAKPPIGNLRFANPEAANSWTGTLNASIDGNACLQFSSNPFGSEDCLTINVYTPKLPEKSSSKLLPVMVWIHGGAFKQWDHHSDRFGPEYLLDADVVLAVPSYRLGPFGFLSTGDEVASGNWGLKDQILALHWVQKNIEYFGGDPHRVTLFGESAGAVSVHLLTLSDATKGSERSLVEMGSTFLESRTILFKNGLFHKYITQSGSALAPWAHHPRARYARRAFELGKYVGCSNETSASLVTCLRGINASVIRAAYSKFNIWVDLPNIVWSPTDEPDIDGAVLTDSPDNIIAAGKIRDLPWISGVTRDEGILLLASLLGHEKRIDNFLDKFDTLLPELLSLSHQPDSGAAWVKAIKSYYFNDDLTTTNKSEIMTKLATLVSDALFFYPAHSAIQQQLALAVIPQYFYTFDYRGSLSFSLFTTGSSRDWAVTHSDDVIYLFENKASFPLTDVTRTESDFRMVDTMVDLWTSFAINGTPSTTANNNTVAWEAYSTKDNYLQIGDGSDLGMKMRYSFFEERMQFWNSLNSATHTSKSTTIHPPSSLALLLPTFKLILCILHLYANR